MSLGYAYDIEKTNLAHHVIIWSSKWQNDYYEFTTGLGFLQNSFNYVHYKVTTNDPWINPTVTNTYRLNAKITYRYLRIPSSINFCIIKTKKFKLFTGIFGDLDIKIAEKGSQFKTWQETIKVTSFNQSSKKEVTIHPMSEKPFETEVLASELFAMGLHIAPRFILNKSYIQFDLKTGFRYTNRIIDYDSKLVDKKANPDYKNLNGYKQPLMVSIGFSYGYYFKSKK